MKSKTKIILSLLAFVLIFVWATLAKSPSADINSNSLQAYFLNVGQGDATLLQKGDFQILIDGGPDESVLTELGKVMPAMDRRIEIMVLSHPHADHVTGLNSILNRFQVGTIYGTGVLHTSNTYLEFLSAIKEKKIDYKIPDNNLTIIPVKDLKLSFLYPGQKYNQQLLENLNNSSEVVKACCFDDCIMLPGDLEIEGQQEMLRGCSQNSISCDFYAKILKTSHHGSANGTNESFLNLVKPKYAVVSVGANNKFGHPHQSIIDLLSIENVMTYRTDRDGTIRFGIDDTGITKF